MTKWMLLKVGYISLRAEWIGKKELYQRVTVLHQKRKSINQYPSHKAQRQLKDLVLSLALLQKHAPWQPLCYNRALTAMKILMHYDVKPQLHIGFRKNEGEFDGHAWVTVDNIYITGYRPDLSSYKRLL